MMALGAAGGLPKRAAINWLRLLLQFFEFE